MKPRILIIEDDRNVCELIQLMLQTSNPDYEITAVSAPEEGLRLAAAQRFDLCVLDYRFEAINGIDVCRTLRGTDAVTRIMFFTGEDHERIRQEAIRAGADAYLVKPNHLKSLTVTVQQLLSIDRPAAARGVPLKANRPEMSV